jgi:hypothetical protein
MDRDTGLDLTWQWTLAVVVCAAGVFKKRKHETEFVGPKLLLLLLLLLSLLLLLLF